MYKLYFAFAEVEAKIDQNLPKSFVSSDHFHLSKSDNIHFLISTMTPFISKDLIQKCKNT